jgi:DNA-binding CsgD family transcriptional regulator
MTGSFRSSEDDVTLVVVVGTRRLYLEAICELLASSGRMRATHVPPDRLEKLRDSPTVATSPGGVDVVLLDWVRGDTAELSWADGAAAVFPGARILALSAGRRDRHSGVALVNPHDGAAALLAAVDPSRSTRKRPRPQSRHESASKLELSGRESDVLELMVGGCSAAEVAEKLEISPHTVRTHIQNVMTKLGARSRVEMINAGRLAGVRSPGARP